MLHFTNNAQAELSAALGNDPESDTTISVVDDVGFVSLDSGAAGYDKSGEFQLATLTHPSLPGVYEVVRITGHVLASNTFTVERAFEGDVQSWPSGTSMSARITADMLYSFLQANADGVIVKGKGEDTDGIFIFDRKNSEAYTSFARGAPSAAGGTQFIYRGRSRSPDCIQLSGYPVLETVNAKPSFGTPWTAQDLNLSYPSVGGTFAVDIGVPATWTAGPYPPGMVVTPTTPDGFQYWYDPEARFPPNEVTEPTWNGSLDATLAEDGWWVPTAMPVDFTLSLDQKLVVTEVGFIAAVYSASSTPAVSIGTTAAPTRFANNVALSQITGNNQIHRIPITDGGVLVENLRFQVITAATGGSVRGRFYWRGFFVRT